MEEKKSASRDSTSFIGLSIAASVLLERVAVPGLDGSLSISLIIVLTSTLTLLRRGALLVNFNSLSVLMIFIFVGAMDAALSIYSQTSLSSLTLVSLIQSLLVFRLREGTCDYERLLRFFVKLMTFCATVCILQFTTQYTLGTKIAFFVDFYTPTSFLVKGFNNLNPLGYLSTYYKPNGIFFLEPSYLNQFLAIAVVIEVITACRLRVVTLLLFAIVTTYSGTGLLTLLVLSPYLLMRTGNGRLLWLIMILGLLIWVGSGFIDFGLIFDRAGEFTNDQSSGFARFYGAFLLLSYALSAVNGSLYVGRGPGTAAEFTNDVSFATFDPTWAKLIYEYGLIGTLIYIWFLAVSVGKGRGALSLAVLFTYFVLGGYLADPVVMTLVALLVVWPGSQAIGSKNHSLS